MERPVVLVTMGDPSGIGPEVIVKTLTRPDVKATCRPMVVGDAGRLRLAARVCGADVTVRSVSHPGEGAYVPGVVDVLDLGNVPENLPFGQMSAVGGSAAYDFVAAAVSLALSGAAGAICTAPLNKEALHAAGYIYPGHTELLAELCGVEEVSMMLSSPTLRVVHVTTHVGLLDAVARIEPGLVERTVKRAHAALVDAGVNSPRIVVCGINPHAGENGLFGYGEEETKVEPGLESCRDAGIDVTGPAPADTAFFRAVRGDFDMVVAMYHDQGHGPVKVMGLDAGVNITLGLPFVRTSVDHGTAFDIAGSGKAEEGSLVEALRQAVEMAPRSGSR